MLPRLCTRTRDLPSVRPFGQTSTCMLLWLESNTKLLCKLSGYLGSKTQDSKIQHQPNSLLPSHRYTGTKQLKTNSSPSAHHPTATHVFISRHLFFHPSPADCRPHTSQGTQQRPAQNVITRHRHAVHPCRNKRVHTLTQKTKQAAQPPPDQTSHLHYTSHSPSNGHIIHPVSPRQ